MGFLCAISAWRFEERKSAAAGLGDHRTFGLIAGFSRLDDAAAGRTLPSQSRVDHRCGAPHARLHADRLNRAVGGAGPAFHACIAVADPCFAVILAQNRVRADDKAHAAAGAFLLVEKEGYDVLEINERSHDRDSSG